MNSEDTNKKKKLKAILNSRNIIIALLVIIVILLLFKLFIKDDNNSLFENGKLVAQEVTEESLEEGRTAIPVIDNFTVTTKLPYANLYNPKVNYGNSYLSYKFTNTDTNEVFYESKLVQAGQYVSVNFAELLGIGSFNCRVDIYSYSYDNPEEQKNGGSSNIVITVQK